MAEQRPVSARPPTGRRALILLRHAKAEREMGVADLDRPLTARGRADALAAGAWLARQGLRPDQVLCSPSRRTRQTWDGVRAGIAPQETDEPAAVRDEPAIYHGTAGELLRLLRQVDPGEADTLLLIGHNPTISELSHLLAPEGGTAEGMRTGGIVVHGLGGGWAELRPGAAPVALRHTARAAG